MFADALIAVQRRPWRESVFPRADVGSTVQGPRSRCETDSLSALRRRRRSGRTCTSRDGCVLPPFRPHGMAQTSARRRSNEQPVQEARRERPSRGDFYSACSSGDRGQSYQIHAGGSSRSGSDRRSRRRAVMILLINASIDGTAMASPGQGPSHFTEIPADNTGIRVNVTALPSGAVP
jgi:hypothetical protein